MNRYRPALLALAATLSAGLSACSFAPAYRSPRVAGDTVPGWKTVTGWRPADPSEGAPRGDWWTAFGDPTLDALVPRVDERNQTLAVALATYAQAVATTREARASLFPTVTASGGVTHTYSGSGRIVTSDVVNSATTGTGTTTGTTTGTGTTAGTGTGTGTTSTGTTAGTTTGFVTNGNSSNNFRLTLQATWQPDFFGRVTNTVRNARYTQQARLADLANTRLVLHGELVTDYLSLRETDADIASLTATVTAYRRSLTIAGNRYTAGIVARTDVFQAQSQLASAQSDLEGETRIRAQYEDAIAVLIGENPAGFRLASLGTAWRPTVPTVPVGLPSALLERRPDISSAERQVAAANALIGVQRAAYFPTVTLTGSGGFENNAIAGLFSAASSLWSVGAQVAETLLDFGARRARVAQARAGYDAAVANYRAVTLTGFQEVQDDLVAGEVLGRQEAFLRTASIAADRSEAALRNRYQAGIAIYTDIVTAQATALTARRALLQAQLDRQNATVALVQALGGGWDERDLGVSPRDPGAPTPAIDPVAPAR